MTEGVGTPPSTLKLASPVSRRLRRAANGVSGGGTGSQRPFADSTTAPPPRHRLLLLLLLPRLHGNQHLDGRHFVVVRRRRSLIQTRRSAIS